MEVFLCAHFRDRKFLLRVYHQLMCVVEDMKEVRSKGRKSIVDKLLPRNVRSITEVSVKALYFGGPRFKSRHRQNIFRVTLEKVK
jgi:hypothetical protein